MSTKSESLFYFDILTKMAKICVRAYGSNPINSAIYEAIFDLNTCLKRYLNFLFEYVNKCFRDIAKFDNLSKNRYIAAKTIRNASKIAYNVLFLGFLSYKILLRPIIIKNIT